VSAAGLDVVDDEVGGRVGWGVPAGAPPPVGVDVFVSELFGDAGPVSLVVGA
jgi:hypothetical protein